MAGASGAGAAGGKAGAALFGVVAELLEELGEANDSGASGPSISRATIKQAIKALETVEWSAIVGFIRFLFEKLSVQRKRSALVPVERVD